MHHHSTWPNHGAHFWKPRQHLLYGPAAAWGLRSRMPTAPGRPPPGHAGRRRTRCLAWLLRTRSSGRGLGAPGRRRPGPLRGTLRGTLRDVLVCKPLMPRLRRRQLRDPWRGTLTLTLTWIRTLTRALALTRRLQLARCRLAVRGRWRCVRCLGKAHRPSRAPPHSPRSSNGAPRRSMPHGRSSKRLKPAAAAAAAGAT